MMDRTVGGQSRSTPARAARFEPWLVLLFTLGTITSNAIPNALRLRGETTGSISARYPTLLTPAGYAFSIWSLIYLALLCFATYQLLPAHRDQSLLRSLRRPFLASCLLNGAWIFIWHYELIGISALVIAALLSTLLVCYVRLDRSRRRSPVSCRALVLAPLSLYAAWVTVATIVNVAAALVAHGWQGGPLAPASWSVVMILVAGALAMVVAWPRRDWIYLAVVAWAIAAIAAGQSTHTSIRWTAQAVAVLLLLATVASIARQVRALRDAASPSAGEREPG
jgi:hypothetical protein